jgi:hypothetical protein
MSGNLYLKYDAADTGARPFPTGSTWWLSPAVVLATSDGNYTVTTPPTDTTIDVQVSLMSSATYEIVNVQVWVCDPSTVAGPSTAVPPYQGAPPGQALTGYYVPPGPISTVPVIQVAGFKPYPGMTSMPGGHCCLIANCYGTKPDGTMDGADLTTESWINLPNEVQTDPHVAQHNIFADPTPPGPQMKVITFPFRAATPLTSGAEPVRLEIAETRPAQLRTILDSGLRQLKSAKFAGLRLQVSERPVKYFGLTGPHKEGREQERREEERRDHERREQELREEERRDHERREQERREEERRDHERREVELELEARKSQVLAATVELDPAETPGAAHAFDIVQKDAHGKTQGGFTLVTIARD